jgi:general secretion pathway protein I
MIKAQPSSAGFTLLEVLVAFAILAMAFGALFGAFGAALKGTERTDETRTATVLARTTLAVVGAEIPLEAGERAGVYPNGFAWKVRMTPYGDLPAEGLVVAYDVTLIVSWKDTGARRSLSLRTLRVVPKGIADGA